MTTIELSPLALYAQATGVVQAVLLLLALCSVACWAIILEKALLLARYGRQAVRFERAARAGDGAAARQAGGLGAALISQGRAEDQGPRPGESLAERRQRVEQAMRDVLAGEFLRAEARLPYLATIGSAAPFIGLFGTVWGIMHAFMGIAQASDTSLAVVAPGIAEALFTTAAGLAAAIPASVAYNKIASDFRSMSRRLGLAAAAMARRGPNAWEEAGHDAP